VPQAVVGLRVDVDTYRGTRDGVPVLLDTLAEFGCLATFFFTLGPDNMGRHFWRLLNPRFLVKMLRSRAASLYGWDILLRGLLWPGPVIGKAFPDIIARTAAAGHEVGLHAWDHHAWQTRLSRMEDFEIDAELERGMRALAGLLGYMPRCSAAAGWVCTESALRIKERFAPLYNSDCRGHSVFRPLIAGKVLAPQIPVTLPTYDELIGRDGITDESYNDFLLDQISADRLNVLTIHAEVEGISRNGLFTEFLRTALERNVRFVPLRDLLPEPQQIPTGRIISGALPGRQGQLCLQAVG